MTDLTKWPRLLVVGEPVTREQANEMTLLTGAVSPADTVPGDRQHLPRGGRAPDARSMPLVQTVLTSFGYGHRTPPAATITIDTRILLRDPHVDPGMRELTGADERVRERVMRTPGAARLVAHLADIVLALLEDSGDPTGFRVDVAIGCVGGRHRSVVLVDALAYVLTTAGIGVEVKHLDVDRPVLTGSR